jgi:hypothetical protein
MYHFSIALFAMSDPYRWFSFAIIFVSWILGHLLMPYFISNKHQIIFIASTLQEND